MKRRWVFAFFAMAVLIVAALGGCSPSTEASGGTVTNQPISSEVFSKDVAAGLQARWAITDPINKNGGTATSDQLVTAITAEYDAVSKYKDSQFEDETFGKYARHTSMRSSSSSPLMPQRMHPSGRACTTSA